MSLLSRLVAPALDEEKLPVHSFMAAVAELKRGAPGVTVSSIAVAFGLSAAEEDELESFLTNLYVDGISRELIHDVLLLGEEDKYTLQQCSDRLVNVLTPTDFWPLITHRAFQVVARGLNECVLSGCAVTAQGSPDMTLAIAKGSVLSQGVLRGVTAGNVTISAAHATLPRIDLVVVASDGAKTVRAGTASTKPAPPDLSVGDVCLAFVYVAPADTAISTDQFLDTRMFRTTGPIIVGKLTTPVVRNNTSVQETFITLTLPNGLLVAGRQMRVKCGGSMLLNSGTPTVTLRIAFNGTTLFQDVTGAATADADRLMWDLEFSLIAQANNDQAMVGRLQLSPVAAKTAPASGVGDIAGTAALVNPIGGSSAVDVTTADRDLIVQYTMSVANANNEITLEYATAELI